ncbi:glycosyltransferase [Mucilaginibacter sp.]|uniref:glycosyltransferase n=1 Tax=Mucilaginibacter sp. TaxID=1882438 RepID=UPI0031B5D3C8
MDQLLKGKRILLAHVPLEGHFNPLTGLAKFLQEMGCDVRWYTSAIFAGKLDKLGIRYYPFVKALELNGQNLWQMVPGLKDGTASEKGRLYLKNLFIDRSVEYFEDIAAIYQEFKFDLLIADSMFSAMPLVRYKLHVPVLAIGIVPLIEDSVDVAPYGRALPPAHDQETRDAYAQMYVQKYTGIKDLIEHYRELLSTYRVQVKGSFVFDTLVKEANMYLQIGVPGFEYPRSDMGDNIRFIGALLPYSAPSQRKAWFDERLKQYKKIVLVTQGTVEQDVTKLLIPTLQAFTGTDTLVVATTGGNSTAELRQKYAADNIIIEDFIPFDDVMPYASVYVTNGGYGGTLLSIKHNLPIVAAGVHEGKSEICARIDYFKCGINLKTETPTTEAIYAATETIINDGVYKNSITALNKEMDGYHALDLCRQYINELLLA